VVLFGGTQSPTAGAPIMGNDTWTWDGADWHQASPPTSPSRRESARMVSDPATGHTLLVGADGAGTLGAEKELWSWDGTTWTRLSQQGPPPWGTAAVATDEAAGRVVMVGKFGTDQPSAYYGTWVWYGQQWTKVGATAR
jgi:hypothetical protein